MAKHDLAHIRRVWWSGGNQGRDFPNVFPSRHTWREHGQGGRHRPAPVVKTVHDTARNEQDPETLLPVTRHRSAARPPSNGRFVVGIVPPLKALHHGGTSDAPPIPALPIRPGTLRMRASRERHRGELRTALCDVRDDEIEEFIRPAIYAQSTRRISGGSA